MEDSARSAQVEPRYEVLWPLSRKTVAARPGAPRVADLNGKVICELWDFNFRGETIYPLVREYIKARYPQTTFVEYSNFGNFHGAKAESVISQLPDQLRSRNCDAVIIGIGA